MRFIIKGPLKDNVYNLMRGLSYHFLGKDEKTGEMNYVHSFGNDNYPRFHIYLKIQNGDLVFNLHLDQKRPIYQGAAAHSGEYDGEAVAKEAERIKQASQNA
ncbi:MAG: hypothetical protein Q7K28_01880 [Candidatus Wildermuthbacteria bacterium]|nr:hypothetical protein [Candidatus Wildermuthbacteria bacterium]